MQSGVERFEFATLRLLRAGIARGLVVALQVLHGQEPCHVSGPRARRGQRVQREPSQGVETLEKPVRPPFHQPEEGFGHGFLQWTRATR